MAQSDSGIGNVMPNAELVQGDDVHEQNMGYLKDTGFAESGARSHPRSRHVRRGESLEVSRTESQRGSTPIPPPPSFSTMQ